MGGGGGGEGGGGGGAGEGGGGGVVFFFFNDTATTEIYTLSLHDALPISSYCETLKHGLNLLQATGAREESGLPRPSVRDQAMEFS